MHLVVLTYHQTLSLTLISLFIFLVGKPIDVPKISNPTNEQIEEYHQKFKQAISELFEKEKHKYIENSEKVRLEIL